MELKFIKNEIELLICILLIVPYGIEMVRQSITVHTVV